MSKCWKCLVAPSAVKQNRLLRARDLEDSSFLFGDRWTICSKFEGSDGNEGVIHLPLLQQNDAFSPSKRTHPHLLHVRLHWGAVQRHLDIVDAKANHHELRSMSTVPVAVESGERKCSSGTSSHTKGGPSSVGEIDVRGGVGRRRFLDVRLVFCLTA